MSRSQRGGSSDGDVPPDYAQIDIATIRRARKDRNPQPPPVPSHQQQRSSPSHYHTAAVAAAVAAAQASVGAGPGGGGHPDYEAIEDLRREAAAAAAAAPTPPDVPPHQSIVETGLNPVFRSPHATVPPSMMAMTHPPVDPGTFKYPTPPPRPDGGMDNLDYMLAKLETKSLSDTADSWGPHDYMTQYYK